MTKISSIEQVFVTKLQALYDVEAELTKAIPKMIKVATDESLKMGFTNHLEETKNQAKRLEEIFAKLDVKPKKMKGEGIRGIVNDASWTMTQDAEGPFMDWMIASNARYVEHYEMAGYMSAVELSLTMGDEEITDLLMETLEEEKAADNVLSEAMKENLRML